MRLRLGAFGVVAIATAFFAFPETDVPVSSVDLSRADPIATSAYVVRRGDTLFEIAERAGVSLAELAKANGISNTNLLRIGQQLVIPGGDAVESATAAATGADRPTLSFGASGSAVADLQRALNAAGAKLAVDGAFGPATRSAVITFQQSKGLVPDGVVGPRTWGALSGGGSPTPTPLSNPTSRPVLRLGDQGSAVTDLQRALRDAGITVSADGDFGPKTRAAVIEFQRDRGLTADGIVGPVTWKALGGGGGGSSTPVKASGVKLQRCPVPGGSFINDYGFPRSGGRKHQGNDIFASRGTPIYAPVSGRVEKTPNGLGGNAVSLYGNDGHRYYFGHLNAYGNTGNVKAGALIGTVGNTGNAAGTLPHLHFEIHPNGGAAVNPFPSLKAVC